MSFLGMHMQRAWHLINAENQTVGRLAVQVSNILRGKHKPTYTPGKDMGDHVVIINAKKVNFTGNKWKKKIYYWHSGYPGGLKQRTAKEMLERNPYKVLHKAIMGMIPRNRLRNTYIKKRLFIYLGSEHPHGMELPPSVPSLPPVPRSNNATYHFGLNQNYAHPDTFQWNPYIPKRKHKIKIPKQFNICSPVRER